MKKVKSMRKKHYKISSKQNRLPLIISLLALLLLLPVTLFVSKQKQNLSGVAATNQVCQGILIPAYYGPGPGMDKTIAAAAQVKFLTANIGSGPGTTINTAWAAAITKAKAAGIRVMGYVATHTGSRPSAQVKAEVDAWKQLYGVTDIMFDETSEKVTDIPYYQDLTAYVHNTPGAVDKLNVGWIPPEGYVQAGDILGILEDSYANLNNWNPPSWVHNYPSTHFMAELHHMPNASAIPIAMNKFIQNNIGYVMLTDSTQPWGQFSTDPFWTALVAAVASDCSGSGTVNPPSSTPPYATPTFVCGGSSTSSCGTNTPTPTPQLTVAPSQVLPTDTPVLMPSIIQSQMPTPIQSGPTSVPGSNSGNSIVSLIQLLLQIISQLIALIEKLF